MHFVCVRDVVDWIQSLGAQSKSWDQPAVIVGVIAWGYLVYETVRKVSEFINQQRDRLLAEQTATEADRDWLERRKLTFKGDWSPWNHATIGFVGANAAGFLLVACASWNSNRVISILSFLYFLLSLFGLKSFITGYVADRRFLCRRLAILYLNDTVPGADSNAIRVATARSSVAQMHFEKIHRYLGTGLDRMQRERAREERALLRGAGVFIGNDYQWFVAYVERQPVGRIAVFISNPKREELPSPPTVWFGFFETVESDRVTTALLEAALGWAHGFGCKEITGPFSWSIHGRAGIQVTGFGDDSYPLAAENPPYYPSMLARAGARRVDTGIAWRYWVSRIPDSLVEKAETFPAEKLGVRTTPLQPAHFTDKRLIKHVFSLINEEMSKRLGFTRINDEQVRHFVRSVAPVFDTEISLLLERKRPEADGQRAARKRNMQSTGIVIAVPNYLELDSRRWRLTASAIQLWRRVRFVFWDNSAAPAKRRDRYESLDGRFSARVLYVVIDKSLGEDGRHLWPYLLSEVQRNARRRKYSKIEFSMTLTSEAKLQDSLREFGARPYKEYAFYSYDENSLARPHAPSNGSLAVAMEEAGMRSAAARETSKSNGRKSESGSA